MKFIRGIAQILLAGGLLWGSVTYLGAVVIEGTTPSGKFKTVGVSDTGRFLVETATGSLQHVVVDSGSITSFQGGIWNVQTAVGVTMTVKASTATGTASGAGTVGGAPSIVYPADPLRLQGVFCNEDPTLIILLGGALSQSLTLPAGSCYSPDVPSSFVGDIYGRSTGPTVGWSFIYHY